MPATGNLVSGTTCRMGKTVGVQTGNFTHREGEGRGWSGKLGILAEPKTGYAARCVVKHLLVSALQQEIYQKNKRKAKTENKCWAVAKRGFM